MSRALGVCLLCLVVCSCARKKPPPPQPDRPVASIAATTSASASPLPAKRMVGPCELADAEAITLPKSAGLVESLGVDVKPSGQVRIFEAVKLGDTVVTDIEPDVSTASTGKTLTGGLRYSSRAATALVNGEFAAIGVFAKVDAGWAGLDDLELAFDATTRLTVPLTKVRPAADENDHATRLLYVKRVAAAARDDRWLAAMIASEAQCPYRGEDFLDADWNRGECNYRIGGTRDRAGEPSTLPVSMKPNEIVLVGRDGATLTTRVLPRGPADEEESWPRPDAVTVAAGADSAFVTWRALGAIRTARVGFDLAPMLESPKVIAGGELTPPSTTVDSGGVLRYVWAQRPKPGSRYLLKAAAYAPATGKVSPPAVLSTTGDGDVASPAIAAAKDRLALAWLDAQDSKSTVHLGIGATVEDAASKAAPVLTFDGRGKDLAIAHTGSRIAIVWTIAKAPSKEAIATRFARLTCPAP